MNYSRLEEDLKAFEHIINYLDPIKYKNDIEKIQSNIREIKILLERRLICS
jgi:hypothetical protein